MKRLLKSRYFWEGFFGMFIFIWIGWFSCGCASRQVVMRGAFPNKEDAKQYLNRNLKRRFYTVTDSTYFEWILNRNSIF